VALLDLLVEVRVRRRYQPGVDAHRRAADRLDLPALERPQQLGLQRQRHVPDLVEEEGAPLAAWNLPCRSRTPVATPLAIPNISASIKSAGMAAQLTATKRAGARADDACST